MRDAGARGSFVRIDMEDASCVDDTLAIYRSLRGAGFDNVGIVLQAYLKRTLTDIAELRDLRPSVRLCKGIYVEPGTIAFRDADVIRRSFVSCLDTLLDGGSRVAIATHDEQLIGESLVRTASLPPTATSSRCCSGCARAAPTSSSPQATRSGCTCRSASDGTSTRCGGCRRIHRWPRHRQGDPGEGCRPRLCSHERLPPVALGLARRGPTVAAVVAACSASSTSCRR